MAGWTIPGRKVRHLAHTRSTLPEPGHFPYSAEATAGSGANMGRRPSKARPSVT